MNKHTLGPRNPEPTSMASKPEPTSMASEVDNFTNDSAMMIAWERHLEGERGPDAFFADPFAEVLAGSKGKDLSEAFGANTAKAFGFEGWPEFHKQWTAVRTKFIDDRVAQAAATGRFAQLVNLGAGMDVRPYRLDCYTAFARGAVAVDMATVKAAKATVLKQLLHSPTSQCAVNDVDLDFLDEERTLATELPKVAGFDATSPSLFIAEGLIMYLGPKGKLKLLNDISAVAAPGSVFVLQFMDASESETAKNTPGAVEAALSVEEATRELSAHGWVDFEFRKFGDEALNFGRFPTDRFKPSASFSFCVCTKAAA